MNKPETIQIEKRGQDPKKFTCQVLSRDNGSLLGTAFVVDLERRWLVTCKHVVARACLSRRDANQNGCVQLRFSQLGIETIYSAHVIHYFNDEHDCGDDVVILEVSDDVLSAQIEQAVLGSAGIDYTRPHEFMSYGFREPAGWLAYGTIIGTLPQPNQNLCADMIMLQSQNIRMGMSGAPILDLERNLVVGIITKRWNAGDDPADRDTGFATDCAVLKRWQLELYADEQLDYEIVPSPTITPESNSIIKSGKFGRRLRPELAQAPQLKTETWVKRDDIISQLDDYWNNPEVHLVGLIGFAGQGKSSVARQWVDSLIADKRLLDGVFWWSFSANRDFDSFLEKAIAYAGGEDLLHVLRQTQQAHLVEVLGKLLEKYRLLFVLDGLEVFQSEEPSSYGLIPVEIESHRLKKLLGFFTASGHQSFCLITSRISLLDFIRNPAYRQQNVSGFTDEQARQLLANANISATKEEQIDQLIKNWEGYPLVLRLLADKIAHEHQGDLSKALADPLFPRPTRNEGYYDRVDKVLEYYDSHLSQPEKAFLLVFSIFRHPVPRKAFVFAFKRGNTFVADLENLSSEEFDSVVQRLVARHVLQVNDQEEYSAHPLMTDYYRQRFENYTYSQIRIVHSNVAEYYLNLAEQAAFDGLGHVSAQQSVIEMVYHLNPDGHKSDISEVHKSRVESAIVKSRQGIQLARGQYILVKRLGEGTYAEVYIAFDTSRQQRVAIKILRPEKLNEADAFERFELEFTVVKQLHHSNIIRYYQYYTEQRSADDFPKVIYIVMPLLTGGTLQQRIDQSSQGLSLDVVAYILKKLASALAYAHSKHLIHRDVKPSNVLFDEFEEPYLADFGLVKLQGRAVQTQSGVLIGTPAYMSPEQWKGVEISAKSDQYSLGIMAYQLVTGRLPFEANQAYVLMNNHLNDIPTPLRERRPDVPEAVSEVILKALAKTPEERYENTMAFAIAFAQATEGWLPPRPRRPVRLTLLNSRPFVAAVVILVLVGLMVVVIANRNAIAGPESTPTLTEPVVSGNFTDTPDGRATAYHATQTALAVPPLLTHTSTNNPTRSSTPTNSATQTPDGPATAFSASATHLALAIIYEEQTRAAISTVIPTVPTNPPTLTETATSTYTMTPSVPPPVVPTSPPWSRSFKTLGMFNSQVILETMVVGRCYPNESAWVRCIDQPFEISITPIRNRDYRACYNALQCAPPDNFNLFTLARDNYAVVGVNFDTATKFCEAIGGSLPTEIEWDYAAMGVVNMGSDVAEWVDTDFDTTSASFKVARGDGINHETRSRYFRSDSEDQLGFRCVFSLPP